MTYRERREARAERLRGWADKRTTGATQTLDGISERYRGDHAFNTQPGHIPERARVIAREDRAFESLQKADGMSSKAASIESATDRAIYMDDPDAIERLGAKIAELEAERDRKKAINAEARKHKKSPEAFREWLATQEPRDRDALTSVWSMYSGAGEQAGMRWAKYDLTNIGGTISKEKKRLSQLTGAPTGTCQRCGYKESAHKRGIACETYTPETTESIATRAKAVKIIFCRYAGTCGECGATINKGDQAKHVERGIIACYPEC